jgi:hypothetical protein
VQDKITTSTADKDLSQKFDVQTISVKNFEKGTSVAKNKEVLAGFEPATVGSNSYGGKRLYDRGYSNYVIYFFKTLIYRQRRTKTNNKATEKREFSRFYF